MKVYSTRDKDTNYNFSTAVVTGIAPDGGLFMPKVINKLSDSFFEHIEELSPTEISYQVAKNLIEGSIKEEALKSIVTETVNFPCEVKPVEKDIYALELFHGPTLAFKDYGARFLSRTLRYLLKSGNDKRKVNVLVATSGDTGSAVANGFYEIEDINVFILYPKDKVSKAQEAQFATLGKNIHALEVNGTFDDCQRLVKEAFANDALREKVYLTSANSINIARLLPQTFYYFIAYSFLKPRLNDKKLVISVPSGNFGNLTAGIIAKLSGLPISRFIAANNENNVFYQFKQTGRFIPVESIKTVANAMDVGNPSNFERLVELDKKYGGVFNELDAYYYNDITILNAISNCYTKNRYLLDPHGACGYLALKDSLQSDETGVFLETAHPSKFSETIKTATGFEMQLHPRLKEFLKRKKQSSVISPNLSSLSKMILKINNL